MIASVLLLLIGLADAARAFRSGALRWVATVVVWLVVGALAVAGLGVPVLAVAASVLVALGWVLVVPCDDGPRPRRLWPVLVLALLVVGATVADDTEPSGFLVTAYAHAPLDILSRLSLPTALAGLAVIVFLTRSGNLVTRAALGRADAGELAPETPAPRGWRVRLGRRVIGSVEPPAVPPLPRRAGHALRGGRLIGPLERLLLVALALHGSETIIAAVLTAKGIVRFPEISEDRGTGSKAEEFLVGSLVSWSLSAAAVAYLVVVHAR